MLLDNVMPLLNVPDAAKQILHGGILLIAVTAYAAVHRLRARRGLG